MTFYPPHYQQFPFQEGIFVNPNVFGLPDAHRPKTPTSLINHTGLSPGPLSTPSSSRHPSQGPESAPEQAPQQMIFEDAFDSLSNSPTTSVRTPDHESFEVDLDHNAQMRAWYEQDMTTTQVSHGAVPAIDTTAMYNMYNGQVFDEAMSAQPPQIHSQLPLQSRPLPTQIQLPPQTPNNFYGQHYTNQPSQEDPWSGQAPLRSPDVPRSDMVLFDPVTTMGNYTLINTDNWRAHNTDPNYLTSPNEPSSAHDMFIIPQHQQIYGLNQLQTQNASPIEMRVTTASPSPDTQKFNDYSTASPLFAPDSYQDQYATPTLITSIEHVPNSPLASASSPGGSDSVYSSYQHSEAGMHMETRASISHENSFISPVAERSPTRSINDVSFEISPEPEGHTVGPIRRSKQSRAAGRPGGRQLGTHLEARVAKEAHDMRKIGGCWHCVLQRDKCGPGDTCERCMKRSQRPNADCGLGCSRIKLIELAYYFLPTIAMQIHEDANLTRFVSKFIHQWGNQEITLYMTASQKALPRIPVRVYEFIPRGKELLEQIQYNTDPKTQTRIAVKKESPALGMVHINHNEEKTYDKYVSDIVDHHLDAFAEVCWADDDNDFAPRLFKLMTRVKPKSDDEAKLLREVNRLIVTTYIMSHTITIAEETKLQTLSKMHSYTNSAAYVENYTSPRMTNRQLKYFFSRLQRSILSTVLNKLQQIFKSSKGCDKWVAAFVAVVGMCMAHEDQQKTVHQVMQSRSATEGFDFRDGQSQAEIACREIDERMNFISQIFRWKYNRKLNPLRDPERDWEKEIGFGDESSVTFVRSVAQLVKENMNYLQQRQSVSIATANQGKYTARLIGQFLLSFWLPQ